jgi:predicted amidohydrolase
MQTELGNPIQYYLVLKIVFKCESIIDKTLKLILWDTNVFEKKEKYSVRDFVTIVFTLVRQ